MPASSCCPVDPGTSPLRGAARGAVKWLRACASPDEFPSLHRCRTSMSIAVVRTTARRPDRAHQLPINVRAIRRAVAVSQTIPTGRCTLSRNRRKHPSARRLPRSCSRAQTGASSRRSSRRRAAGTTRAGGWLNVVAAAAGRQRLHHVVGETVGRARQLAPGARARAFRAVCADPATCASEVPRGRRAEPPATARRACRGWRAWTGSSR